MKHAETRSYADPEAAARMLLELASGVQPIRGQASAIEATPNAKSAVPTTTNTLSGPQSSHPPKRASAKPATRINTETIFVIRNGHRDGKSSVNHPAGAAFLSPPVHAGGPDSLPCDRVAPSVGVGIAVVAGGKNKAFTPQMPITAIDRVPACVRWPQRATVF